MARPPSLRQLEYFVAVAEELNFRRAAERLCITQPPLTRQIQALEAALGARLFDRDRRSVQLTEAGQRFLAQARALVQQVAHAVRQFEPTAAALQAPVLRLGITTVVDVSLFGGLAPAFEAAWPGRQLRIQRQISAQLIRDLHRGELDLAVIGLPSRTEGLALQPLGDDPLVACLAARHPLAQRRRIPLQALAADTLFWFNRRLNPAYFDHCEQVFNRLAFHPPRVAEPAEHPVLLGLIAEGRGFALVPQSLNTVRRSGVVFRRILEEDDLRIRLAAAWPTDRPPARADDWVALLRAQWAGAR